MKGGYIYLLLFGIIIFGLAYYFLQYSSKEGFQSEFNTIFESDKFLNNTLNPVIYDFQGFSNAYRIKREFTEFLTDWHSFSGYIDINPFLMPEEKYFKIIRYIRGQTEAESGSTSRTEYLARERYKIPYKYVDSRGIERIEYIGGDIFVQPELDNGAVGATAWRYTFSVSLYYENPIGDGARGNGVDYNSVAASIGGDANKVLSYVNVFAAALMAAVNAFGNINFWNGVDGVKGKDVTFINNFTKFVNIVQSNVVPLKRAFIKNLKLWDINELSNRINPTNYLASNTYNLVINRNPEILKMMNVTVRSVANREKSVTYDIGKFKGIFPSKAVELNAARDEKIRLVVYGNLCNYHTNDFQECIHWGSAFDFSDVNLLESYLNIPYTNYYHNGSNLFYSYGLFLPEMKPVDPARPMTYISNTPTYWNNFFIINLRNDVNNTLQIPVNLNAAIGYDGYGYINSVTFNNGVQPPSRNIIVPTYTPNGTTIQITYNATFHTIASTRNISELSLQEKFVGEVTPQMLSKMPSMMRRYITSWNYNRSQRILDARLSGLKASAGANGEDMHTREANLHKAAELLRYATNNLDKAMAENNSELTTTWSNYLVKYLYNNVTNITSNTGATNTAPLMNTVDDADCIPVTMSGITVNNPNSYIPNYNINLLATGILHYPHWYQYKGNRIQYNKSANRYKIISVPVTSQNTDNNFFNYRWDITGENPNITYKNNGGGIRDQAWDLDDNTIAFMISDYKANMVKILPDHGAAATINILDQKMLDSIAQTFYEYSDGLFEIYYIYDIFIIGSNMMDIRFDKKQRLAPETFITLRNQYNPKIAEYNKLLSMYEDGTWVESYSKIDDLQSNISTSLKALGPVLNPAYPTNNGNPDTIQTEIRRLTLLNETLQSQIDNAAISTEARLKNEASRLGANVSSSSGLLTLQNAFSTTDPNLNIGDLQEKLNNNIDTINNLLSQLDGIETNVARIFFTMNTPDNLVVNGIALGPNAALSYNTIYNGSLQVDMGQSQGNVNYSPTIIYTKNVTPNINPSNIDFIKQAAQLYMDGITTTLSSFTSNTFIASNGTVRVDKIYGFSKLDDVTCGFTWQESQYDFYTNKPNVRRVVDIALKFAFDNIEYQNPQIYIDNKVDSIYLTSSNLDLTASNYNLINESNIQRYQNKIVATSNDIQNMYSNNYNIIRTLSNYLVSNTIYYKTFERKITFNYRSYRESFGNSYTLNLSNVTYTPFSMLDIFNETYSNNFSYSNLSNFFKWVNRLPQGISSNIVIIPEYSPISNLPNYPAISATNGPINNIKSKIIRLTEGGVNYNMNLYNLSTNVNTGTTNYERNYFIQGYSLRNNYGFSNGYLYVNNVGSVGVAGDNYTDILHISNISTSRSVSSRYLTYIIDIDNYLKVYQNNLITIGRKELEISNINTVILNTRNLDSTISNTYINGDFKFGMLQNGSEAAFTVGDYVNIYKDELYHEGLQRVVSSNRVNYNTINQYNSTVTNLSKITAASWRTGYSGGVASASVLNFVTGGPPPWSRQYVSAENESLIRTTSQFYSRLLDEYNRLQPILRISLSNMPSNVDEYTIPPHIIIKRIPEEEETLDNNDGACPANMTCGNPEVMNQLMDYYNLDSNNSNKITRIFKAFTPNAYKCDYSVEMTDSNRRVQRGTIGFEVAQNIEDCSYVITSNTGFNTGYYIIDKVKYVKDNATDISGYQYVSQNLVTFSNSVDSLIKPLIKAASNAATTMYDAYASSRLLTYTSLGKINVISNIATCENLNYDRLSNLIINKQNFVYSIFNSYPYFDSHINKIIRVGITPSNMMEIVFERINLGVISNVIREVSRDTAGALYRIKEGTPGFCDYTAEFVTNSMPSPPSKIKNLSTPLDYINYTGAGQSGYSFIYNDFNIVNPMGITRVEPMSKKVVNEIMIRLENDNRLYTNQSYTNINLHSHITNINKYEFINANTVAYTVDAIAVQHPKNSFDVINSNYSNSNYIDLIGDLDMVDEVARNSIIDSIQYKNWKFLIIATFEKSQVYNVLNFKFTFTPFGDITNNVGATVPNYLYPINITNRNTTPQTGFITNVNKTLTNIPNDFILTNTVDFNNTNIKNLAGFPNIAAYRIDPSNNNICEYYLNFGDSLPIEKNYFKVHYYTDNWLNSNSSNTAVYTIVPATIENSLFNIDITGIEINSLLNIFKSHYELQYRNALVANFHTLDSVSGNSLITSVSIIYRNDLLTEFDTVKNAPNIQSFNNEKFFKIYYHRKTNVEIAANWINTRNYTINTIVRYNSLYYTARFANAGVQPDSTQLVTHAGSTVQKGALYWGTGAAALANPVNSIIVYNYIEIPRLLNPTSFTYATPSPIPSKNTYLDNMLWSYVRFRPVLSNPSAVIPNFTARSITARDSTNRPITYTTQTSNYQKYNAGPTYQISQFEFFKDNIKIIINTNEYYSNIFNYNNVIALTNSNILLYEKLYYNRGAYYTRFQTRSNTTNFSLMYGPIYEDSITISFVQPTNFNGFSFTTGNSIRKNPKHWIIEGSTDNSNWVTLRELSNARYSPQAFYRTKLYNFKDGAADVPLMQNPYYKLTLYECADFISGDDLLVRNLYNYYTIASFNNDMTIAFENYPKGLRVENLDLLYYYEDPDNNALYHILKARNLRENVDVYFLYVLEGFQIEPGCTNLTSSVIPYYLSNISSDVITKLAASNSNCSTWLSSNDCLFYNQFTAAISNTVFAGITSNIFNEAKFCSNYKSNKLLDIFEDYIGGQTADRFELSYNIRYKKSDVANSTYSYILENVQYRKIYTLNDEDYSGIIQYTDSVSVDTILDTYVYSNIIIPSSNLPYINLGTYEIKISLTTSNDILFECVSYTDNLTFLNTSNYTHNIINISDSNILTYVSANNFTILERPIEHSLYDGADLNNLVTTINPYSYVSNIKNNCGGPGGLNFSNPNIIPFKFRPAEYLQIPVYDIYGEVIGYENGPENKDEYGNFTTNPIYNPEIFNNQLLATFSNTYNMSLVSDVDPYIAYGKQDSNDSLKYYYIACVPGTDTLTSLDTVVYAECSIKWYYGANSNRNFSNIAFVGNLPDAECNSLRRIVTLLNLYTEASINTYVPIGNYEILGKLAQYNICSNYINTTYQGLDSLAYSPIAYYAKLLYTRDRINPYFKKDFVYICYYLGDLKNPLFKEYSVTLREISSDCSNLNYTFDYKRDLTVSQVNNLSNQSYVKYFNNNYNTPRELSNVGITYSNIVNNFGGYQTMVDGGSIYIAYNPMNITTVDLQSVAGYTYKRLANINPDNASINYYYEYIYDVPNSYEDLGSAGVFAEGNRRILYTKYEYKYDTSIYSFILLGDDNWTLVYSIYVFYNNSNSSTPFCGIDIENISADASVGGVPIVTFSASNGYVENVVSLSQSEKMNIYGINANNPVFRNSINTALSNLKNNATFSNNLFTIRYIYTDYSALENRYLAAYWPPETELSFETLASTPPAGFLRYTIQLSNITSSNSYDAYFNGVYTLYSSDFDTTSYSNGINGVFYRYGVQSNTTIIDLAINSLTCTNYFSPNDINLTDKIFGITILQNGPVETEYASPSAIIAYKKNIITRTFTYILHYRTGTNISGINNNDYFPIVNVTLSDVTDSSFVPTACSDFFTASPQDMNGNTVVNIVYSSNITISQLMNYITTNNMTSNYISNYLIIYSSDEADESGGGGDGGGGGGGGDGGGGSGGGGIINASNCFNSIQVNNTTLISNILFTTAAATAFVTMTGVPDDFTTNPPDSTMTAAGVYAYKKNLTLNTFDYILDYQVGLFGADTHYYPLVRINFVDPPESSLTSCTSFIDDTTNTNLNFVNIINSANLTTYVTTNGFSNIYILNENAVAGFQDYRPANSYSYNSNTIQRESFAEYRLQEPVKIKEQETYSYISFNANNSYRFTDFKLYTSRDAEVPTVLVKSDVNSNLVQNPRKLLITGYSFITNTISSNYDPKEWVLKGTNDGRNWEILDSRKLGKNIARGYQLPLIYLNGRTKPLPQPVIRVEEKPVEETIDKAMLVKYYKQKINPSITPDYKKFLYDRSSKTHYFLYDEYDLNRNLISKDLIIGFILQGSKVKKPVLYENEDGAQVPFNLAKKYMKQFWEKNIMVPLLFEDF